LRFRAFIAEIDKEGSLKGSVRLLEGTVAEHVICFGPDHPETQTAVHLYRQAVLTDSQIPRHQWGKILSLSQLEWELTVRMAIDSARQESTARDGG
jgi:hypothetical protein